MHMDKHVTWIHDTTGLALGLHPANERRRYEERRLSLALRKPGISP